MLLTNILLVNRDLQVHQVIQEAMEGMATRFGNNFFSLLFIPELHVLYIQQEQMLTHLHVPSAAFILRKVFQCPSSDHGSQNLLILKKRL